ncbi:MAG: SUMF1/EgtB/PvdO family nonheme iron enzyme [Pseudomonadota bacterium]
MADVFISYKREDKPKVENVAIALQEVGFSVWWDDRIRPEGEWDAQIEREISDAKAVVVMWTPRSVQSRWVRAEAHNGQERGILIPAKLEPCDIPIAFSLSQTADLTDWGGASEHRQWRKLLVWIEDLVRGASVVTETGASVAAPRRGTFGTTPDGDDILDGATVTSRTPGGSCFADGPDLLPLRIIPAGSFVMGASANSPGAQRSEGPPYVVSFEAPFAVGVYPVTFGQWDALTVSTSLEHRPADNGWGREDRPVINVSWNDAVAFCDALSDQTGERYRLLSEAEWEYACRSGSKGPFGFMDPVGPDAANYDCSQSFDGGPVGEPLRKTSPVGNFPSNGYGLHDMHGNVREWVADTWHDDYIGAPDDGLPWSAGHSAMHVVRGGSWLDAPWLMRSSARGRGAQGDRAPFIGFRVARDIS